MASITNYADLLQAANVLTKSKAAAVALIYDGTEARELNEREQRFVHEVCKLLGVEAIEVDAA